MEPDPSSMMGPRRQDRYARQMAFAPIGPAGQQRLLEGRVVIFGCGALGSVLANTLVRAGVGFVRLVDSDRVELSNLQRQVVFDEQTVGQFKATATRDALARVNSDVEIEAVVARMGRDNIIGLADGADVLLDGTDNFEARLLINDLAVKSDRPWMFGACAGSRGMAMAILPNRTPCLRCLFEEGLPADLTPTAQTDGILASVVNRVASYQALEAMKVLMGCLDAMDRRLLTFDVWTGRDRRIDVQPAYDQGDCACCKGRRFVYLDG